MDGVLGVDKARGPTSHDAVERLRRLLSLRQVGHAGTLDPDASGVLILCLGRATKVSRYLMDGEKEYRATLRLGFRTDTGDRTGRPVERARLVRVNPSGVQAVCRRWVGEVEQVPPMVSAVKRDGVRLYKLARAGVEIDRAPRRVRIDEIDVVDVLPPLVSLRLRCGSGVYVRALAEDIGEELGCGAHVFTLRRTRVGSVGLDECVKWNDLDTLAKAGRLSRTAMPVDRALGFLPALTLSEEEDRRIRTGRGILREGLDVRPGPPAWVRLRDRAGNLVAVGFVSEGRDGGTVAVRPARVLSPLE